MRGVYSFVLVFVFMVCALLIASTQGRARESLSSGTLTAMEIEKASFKRFELEENTDALIEETIDSAIMTGNHDGFIVNKKIASALLHYYREMEGKKGLGMETRFFEIKTKCLSKNFTPTTCNLKALKAVDKYCKTIVVNLKEHVFLVRFEFTGGILKDNAVLGRIKTPNSEQYFLLLPGYSLERVVVA